jgi:hypothetical protein
MDEYVSKLIFPMNICELSIPNFNKIDGQAYGIERKFHLWTCINWRVLSFGIQRRIVR